MLLPTYRSPKNVSGVKMVDLDTLLKESDVISINSAYVESMKNLINTESISKMKEGVALINTGRAEFVDDSAVIDAVKSGKMMGYGTDVLSDYSEKNLLLSVENIIVTPHVAWFTGESLQNMADIIVANIESYAAGNPQNVINK